MIARIKEIILRNSMSRWKTKMMAKTNWYEDKNDTETSTDGWKAGKKKTVQKAGKDTIKISTVIFVPSTIGGKLVTMLKDREDELARITKFRV
jgi:hypothetical protein